MAFDTALFVRARAAWQARTVFRFDARDGTKLPPARHIAELARRIVLLDAAGKGAFAEDLRRSERERAELNEDAHALVRGFGQPAIRALAALIEESDDNDEALAEQISKLVTLYSDQARAATTAKTAKEETPAPSSESGQRALCSEAEPCGDPDCPRHEARTDNAEIDWAAHGCDPNPPHMCFRTDTKEKPMTTKYRADSLTAALQEKRPGEDPEDVARRRRNARNANAWKYPVGATDEQIERIDAAEAARDEENYQLGLARSPAERQRQMQRRYPHIRDYQRVGGTVRLPDSFGTRGGRGGGEAA